MPTSEFLLPKPWELLLLQHDQKVSFRVNHYLLGVIEIHPKDAPAPREITILRIWPFDTSKEHHATWWDISYSQVIAAMVPILQNPRTMSSKFLLEAHAYGKRKNFTITVSP